MAANVEETKFAELRTAVLSADVVSQVGEFAQVSEVGFEWREGAGDLTLEVGFVFSVVDSASPYRGGIFTASFDVRVFGEGAKRKFGSASTSAELSHPRYTTKIYHPSISVQGGVGLIAFKGDPHRRVAPDNVAGSLAAGIVAMINVLRVEPLDPDYATMRKGPRTDDRFMLFCCLPCQTMNKDAAEQFRSDRAAYDETAALTTLRYASI